MMNTAELHTPLVEATMLVKSDILGAFEVPAERVTHFADGLLGFPDARRFVLVPADTEGAYWLQSVEHSALIFLAVDPFIYVPDYAVDLSASDVASLEARSNTDIVILAIVTLPAQAGGSCTANLQGPLALNLGARLGRQVVLRNMEAGVRRPIRLAGGEAADGSSGAVT